MIASRLLKAFLVEKKQGGDHTEIKRKNLLYLFCDIVRCKITFALFLKDGLK